MSTSLFECKHLLKRYGDHTVVNDVSFDIAPGECLGVIGPNGAGKTTLFNLLSCMVKPTTGSIKLAGEELVGLLRPLERSTPPLVTTSSRFSKSAMAADRRSSPAKSPSTNGTP